MKSQDGNSVAAGANFDFGSGQANRKANSRPRGAIKATMDVQMAAVGEDGGLGGSATKVMPKGTRFQGKDKQVQMSPKVLETWINETL